VHGEARKTAIPHVAALDGARGVAVAGVLLFHGDHLTGGYLGVDFFFVLSGFLITSLLLAESDRTGSVGLGGFWARRARRLLPALAVMMVGIALYCVAFARADQLAQIRGDALSTLGYVANWHEIFSHQSYFALFTAPSPLNHTWSLAIEEQFYVIWPLVFVALLSRFKRATPRAVLVTSLALAAISSVLMLVLYDPASVSRAYFGTDTRAAAILFGAALAAWLATHEPSDNRGRRIALEAVGLAGVVTLAICWTRLDGQSSFLYQGGFLLCGLAATAIIAAAVHPQPGLIARALALRPLTALGLISYGVYLYHWPIDIALDRKEMGFGGWPLFGFQTAVTLAVAIASYRIVEQPIRHGALSAIQWRKLTPVVTIALVVAIVTATAGGDSREPEVLSFPRRAAQRAFDTAPPGSKRVMIFGDSVAFFLGKEFAAIRPKPPLAVFNAGIQGCKFFPGVTKARYHNAAGSILVQNTFSCDPPWLLAVVRRFKPDIVFWILSNPAEAVQAGGRWFDTCSPAYASRYAARLKEVTAAMGALGAKVALTTGAYPRYIYANSDRETDCDNRILREVAPATGAQLIDLQSYICPGGKCREKQDGATLRPDGEHYEGRGGEIVAQWLLDQVR
jgi:peptidoglycan/LPS O-acetylase OafA/YrhL